MTTIKASIVSYWKNETVRTIIALIISVCILYCFHANTLHFKDVIDWIVYHILFAPHVKSHDGLYDPLSCMPVGNDFICNKFGRFYL